MKDEEYKKLIYKAMAESNRSPLDCPNSKYCRVEVVHLLGTTYDYCTNHYKKFKREKNE